MFQIRIQEGQNYRTKNQNKNSCLEELDVLPGESVASIEAFKCFMKAQWEIYLNYYGIKILNPDPEFTQKLWSSSGLSEYGTERLFLDDFNLDEESPFKRDGAPLVYPVPTLSCSISKMLRNLRKARGA